LPIRRVPVAFLNCLTSRCSRCGWLTSPANIFVRTLASVRAEHQGFCRRVFLNSLSPPRDYPGLTKPIGLMAIDFSGMREEVFARYPYLRSSDAERRAPFERAIPPVAAPPDVPEFPHARASIIP
jgi:hypothetical protein